MLDDACSRFWSIIGQVLEKYHVKHHPGGNRCLGDSFCRYIEKGNQSYRFEEAVQYHQRVLILTECFLDLPAVGTPMATNSGRPYLRNTCTLIRCQRKILQQRVQSKRLCTTFSAVHCYWRRIKLLLKEVINAANASKSCFFSSFDIY